MIGKSIMGLLRERWVRITVGFLITGAFVYLVARKVDMPALLNALRQVQIAWLGLGLAGICGSYLLRALRWQTMLVCLSVPARFKSCLIALLISTALNNVLVLRAGDLVRIFGFRRYLHTQASVLLGTLILERLLDLMVLLTFLFLASWWLPPHILPEGVVNGAFSMLLLIVGAFAAVLLLPRSIRRATAAVRSRFPRLTRLADALDDLSTVLVRLCGARAILRTLSLSVAAWLFEGTIFLSVALALRMTVNGAMPFFSLSMSTL